ncbi:MAG TPA: glycosyltransferase [Syntrophorhabdales bacterium]|nr:glycosyltransferase [Syntrophorhabdales bacterium]
MLSNRAGSSGPELLTPTHSSSASLKLVYSSSFRYPAPGLSNTPPWECWVKMAIALGAASLLVAAWWSGTFHTLFRFIPDTALGNLWLWSLTSYGFAHYVALIWRVSLWLRYRPLPPVAESELPSVSIVIPVYNEGPLVRDSILSVANGSYPRDRLQVIVVDDGSTDDTWQYIQRAVHEAKIEVLTIRNPENRGKRDALHRGFGKATGEVWITVDSDSVVEPDALENGVSALVHDPKIGCVAGSVKVLNRNDSLITRFLKISFSLSFAFSRAYQSQIRGLLTTPGALSIYRASAVKPVLSRWIHQRFLGVACLTGEDRALTNLITAQGFYSIYQSNAVVWSKMPISYAGMTKMFLRWARSNIRETAFLFSYLFKPFRADYVWGFRINSVLVASTLVVPYVLIGQSYALMLTKPLWLFRHVVMITLLGVTMALIYYRNERDSDFLWVILYEFFWVLACQWIIPYAFLTCRHQGAWITRGTTRSSHQVTFKNNPRKRVPGGPEGAETYSNLDSSGDRDGSEEPTQAY